MILMFKETTTKDLNNRKENKMNIEKIKEDLRTLRDSEDVACDDYYCYCHHFDAMLDAIEKHWTNYKQECEGR